MKLLLHLSVQYCTSSLICSDHTLIPGCSCMKSPIIRHIICAPFKSRIVDQIQFICHISCFQLNTTYQKCSSCSCHSHKHGNGFFCRKLECENQSLPSVIHVFICHIVNTAFPHDSGPVCPDYGYNRSLFLVFRVQRFCFYISRQCIRSGWQMHILTDSFFWCQLCFCQFRTFCTNISICMCDRSPFSIWHTTGVPSAISMRRIKCWISQQTIHCFLNRTIFTQLMIFHAGCIVRIIICKSICIQHICRTSHIVKMPRCFLIISRTFHLTIQSRFFKNRSISVFIGNL